MLAQLLGQGFVEGRLALTGSELERVGIRDPRTRSSSHQEYPGDEATIRRIREGYDYRKHMESEAEHRRLVPDRLVERFAVAGTPAECRRQIGSLFELPVDEVALVPFPAPGADRGELLHRLRSEVLDPIRNGSNAKRSDK